MSDNGQQPQRPSLRPDLAAWIGRSTERTDVISPRMAESFLATLKPHLAAGPGAPLGLFWCLAPDIVAREDLGNDGHPRTGIFLPAMPYPRRMWAGGELRFHAAFHVGDVVTKTSTIEDIAFKTGSSGKLAFLTFRHRYRVGDHLILDERQDVVYRDVAPSGRVTPSAVEATAPSPTAHASTVELDPTLLFRYSALTFNGHRIHYDRAYATEVEGYDGLVVHGPLQATLLLNLAATAFGKCPRRFSYRGQAPLICDEMSVRVEAAASDPSLLKLKVLAAWGTATMVAEANMDDAACHSSNR